MLAYQPDSDALEFHRRMAADAVLVATLGGSSGAECVGYWLWDALTADPPRRGASWRRVYGAVDDLLVELAADADLSALVPYARARERLRQFLDENADLAEQPAMLISA